MKFTAVLSLLLPSAALGNRDSAYYPGWSNPNVNDDMYYRDAINVLQGVNAGEFQSLYIKYHGCVWSEYGNGAPMYPYGEEEDGNDENDVRCGGNGGNNGEYYWYLGATQCFRANVAYSLYGIKKGKYSKNACSRHHYINSFFTTYGVESFGDPLGLNVENYGASSKCESDADENGDGGGGDNDGYYKGDYYYNNKMMFEDYTSYGTACNANGQFITAEFQGAYCDGQHFSASQGEIEDLNELLEDIECQQVYAADGSIVAYNADEEDNGENDYGEGANSPAFLLLTASAACSHTEYPGRCPDPHGIKEARDQLLYKVSQSHHRAVPLVMPIISALMFLAAIILFKLSSRLNESVKNASLDGLDAGGHRKLKNPIMLTVSQSFERVVTDITHRTARIKEKLIEYAEEQVEDIAVETSIGGDYGDYQSPEPDYVARSATPDPSVESAKAASRAATPVSVPPTAVQPPPTPETPAAATPKPASRPTTPSFWPFAAASVPASEVPVPPTPETPAAAAPKPASRPTTPASLPPKPASRPTTPASNPPSVAQASAPKIEAVQNVAACGPVTADLLGGETPDFIPAARAQTPVSQLSKSTAPRMASSTHEMSVDSKSVPHLADATHEMSVDTKSVKEPTKSHPSDDSIQLASSTHDMSVDTKSVKAPKPRSDESVQLASSTHEMSVDTKNIQNQIIGADSHSVYSQSMAADHQSGVFNNSVAADEQSVHSASGEKASVDGSAKTQSVHGDAPPDNKATADALLTERGLPPKPTNALKKYKRPFLAKLSKFLFRRRKYKNQAKI